MSVIVKGMKMPAMCVDCRFCDEIDATCIALNDNSTACITGKSDWCPLIEVPTPHGRLIDADEAISHPNMAEKNGRKLNPNYDKEWFRHCVTYARLVIETSPTIIEEEGK